MAPTGAKKGKDGGVGDVINDLWILIRDYAKQETVDPLKALGRFVGYGIGGAALLALGLAFGALALLRMLQTETGDHLTGKLTWVPYGVTFVLTAAVVGLAIRTITKPNRTEPLRIDKAAS